MKGLLVAFGIFSDHDKVSKCHGEAVILQEACDGYPTVHLSPSTKPIDDLKPVTKKKHQSLYPRDYALDYPRCKRKPESIRIVHGPI